MTLQQFNCAQTASLAPRTCERTEGPNPGVALNAERVPPKDQLGCRYAN